MNNGPNTDLWKKRISESRMLDLADKRFGMWKVLSFSRQTTQGRSMWNCVCDCGKNKQVRGERLVSGDSIGCGCVKRKADSLNKIRNGIDVAFKIKLYHYASSARRRGIIWDLNPEKVKELFAGNCHYCGCQPSNKAKIRVNNKYIDEFAMMYSGIDRVDNTKGYVDGNVVSCCKACNTVKGSMTIADFKEWMSRFINHNKYNDINLYVGANCMPCINNYSILN